MKDKKIWSADTAAKVASAKFAKYGVAYFVVPAKGGGFNVTTIGQMTVEQFKSWSDATAAAVIGKSDAMKAAGFELVRTDGSKTSGPAKWVKKGTV